MSLPSAPMGPIPAETIRIARAAFPKGTLAMRLRDMMGTLYDDPTFADLFSHCGRPAEAPWRLALVTVLQFAVFATRNPAIRYDHSQPLWVVISDAHHSPCCLEKIIR